MSQDTEAKQYVKDTRSVVDAAEVLLKIQQIADSVGALSKFESDFLSSQARDAVKFDKAFRMSTKQQVILARIWNEHYLVKDLAARLAAKIDETKPTKEPPCPGSTSASMPTSPGSSKSSRVKKKPLS